MTRRTEPTPRSRPSFLAARRRPALLVGVVLVAATACTGFDVAFRNKEPFSPPPVYTEWWEATEACSGLSGDMSRISWYTALSITSDALVARGLWSPPHEIVLVKGYEDDEVTVRHEMLHDLLSGDPSHESPLWETCGLIPD